jgi:hypothetical protein
MGLGFFFNTKNVVLESNTCSEVGSRRLTQNLLIQDEVVKCSLYDKGSEVKSNKRSAVKRRSVLRNNLTPGKHDHGSVLDRQDEDGKDVYASHRLMKFLLQVDPVSRQIDGIDKFKVIVKNEPGEKIQTVEKSYEEFQKFDNLLRNTCDFPEIDDLPM